MFSSQAPSPSAIGLRQVCKESRGMVGAVGLAAFPTSVTEKCVTDLYQDQSQVLLNFVHNNTKLGCQEISASFLLSLNSSYMGWLFYYISAEGKLRASFGIPGLGFVCRALLLACVYLSSLSRCHCQSSGTRLPCMSAVSLKSKPLSSAWYMNASQNEWLFFFTQTEMSFNVEEINAWI